MKILDFFERAYVINLPERVDRRKGAEKELQKMGWQFTPGKLELFPGVRPTDPAGFVNIGARGCFLSHLTILKQARDEGLTNVLIIEDDMFIDHEFKQIQDALIDQLHQQDWGFAYFGYATSDNPTGPVKFEPWQGPIITTTCYGVNAAIFDRLIAFLEILQTRSPGDPEGGPMHLDGAYHFFRQRNPDILTLRVSRVMVAQRSSRSDIAATAWYDHIPLVSPMVEWVRQGKTLLRSRSKSLK